MLPNRIELTFTKQDFDDALLVSKGMVSERLSYGGCCVIAMKMSRHGLSEPDVVNHGISYTAYVGEDCIPYSIDGPGQALACYFDDVLNQGRDYEMDFPVAVVLTLE